MIRLVNSKQHIKLVFLRKIWYNKIIMNTTLKKYLIDFSFSKEKSRETKKSSKTLFALASKTILRSKKSKITTASSDIDTIVYGAKR
jgi:hypothetical protein